jgi:cyanophycin synthetase
VLVERYIRGYDYRLLVVNCKMIAAARREPAQVTGDGRSTIEQLVAETNKDPRRRPGHSSSLTQIKLDEAVDLVLNQRGLTRQSVPKLGETVQLRTNANLSTGGTATDVTDIVHPRNARLAELAAQILSLDVAGIDIICDDIHRPITVQGGAIVEVNAAPGLRMHLQPTQGTPRKVGRAIVEMLYPDRAPARIPIVAVTGTNGKTTVTRLVAHMFKTARWTVGMTCTDGIYIGDERITAGDCSGPKSAEAVLLHPHVEAAVLETARGGILREGLGYDGCDVGVVTNVAADHLGMKGINDLETLARVKQVVIDAVYRDGAAVLNADDPLVAAMAADTDANVIYFSTKRNNPIIESHREDGGQCVIIADESIALVRGEEKTELLELERIPFTAGGRIEFQLANALAATAAAWGAGLNPALIARALTTFRTDTATVPGRFNIMLIDGVEVVLDYGHNEAAVNALAQAVHALGKRRTLMVLGLPGDRRDQDIAATAAAAVPIADEFILHDLEDLRARERGAVPEIMRHAIPMELPVEIVRNQRDAIQRAWQKVKPGDRLVVIADEVDVALESLKSLAHIDGNDEITCDSPVASVELMNRNGEGAYRVHANRTR